MSLPSRVQDLQGNAMARVTGSVAAIGETVLIPAPGVGYNIYISKAHFQSESTTSHTIQIRVGSGAGHDGWRVRLVNDGDGELLDFGVEQLYRLPGNKALIINLVAAAAVGYNILYFIKRG